MTTHEFSSPETMSIKEFRQSDFLLSKIEHRPIEGVVENALVYKDFLTFPQVQEELINAIGQFCLASNYVFSGIEAEGVLFNEKLVHKGSEAERDGISDSFYATDYDYWKELVDRRENIDNPFNYAARGWKYPAIAAFDKSKIYLPDAVQALGLDRASLIDGSYEKALVKDDSSGNKQKYSTYWQVRPGYTVETALKYLFYLVPKAKIDKLNA